METWRLTLCLYWITAISAAVLIGMGGAADANVSVNSRYPAINVTVPEVDPRVVDYPAPLVELPQGELDPMAARSLAQVGLASWYGDHEGGRPTAIGERFDPGKLTAAHRTLPLPCRVRVTNLENGKSIVVRVNDRGPYIPGRVLDLSTKAATVLGMQKEGLALVRIEVLSQQVATAVN